MTLSLSEVNELKQVPEPALLPAIAQRWSPRSFSETPISPADLATVLEAARWAPSSSNIQPWRFLVGVQGSETHAKIFSTLVGFNQAWAGRAPVLILGIAELKNNSKPNHYALYDLGQAVAMLIVQAEALGLATHQMGGFDHGAARLAFGLTPDHATGSVIALGHQADPSVLGQDQLIQREVAPRERKPLSEIALAALGTPFDLGV